MRDIKFFVSLTANPRVVEVFYEPTDSRIDVIANRTHVIEWKSLRIAKVPVEVLLAGYHRTGVAASHRDDDISPLRELVG